MIPFSFGFIVLVARGSTNLLYQDILNDILSKNRARTLQHC